MGLCLWWCGVVDIVRLLGLWEHLIGNLLPVTFLVLTLLYVVEVVVVLSFCCGGSKGHFGPFRVGVVLVVYLFTEFFVAADVVALSLLRESLVIGL